MNVAYMLRCVGVTVGLAVLYGIVHDLCTAHVCVEYFTMGHPRVIDSDHPVALAMVWGILVTWWVGLPCGIAFGVIGSIGSRQV